MGSIPRLRDLLDAGPPALPAPLDAAAERWAALPPRPRFVIGVAAALLVLLIAGSGAARSPWGPPIEVLVAARDLPAGHVIAPGDLRPAEWPSALAPGLPTSPEGATLQVGVPAGMPVGDTHLGDGGLASRLEEGQAAFPLPVEVAADLRAGQRVDLVAGDPGGAGLRLAAGATVLTVGADVVWVAVQRDETPALAGAAAWGRIVAVPLPH